MGQVARQFVAITSYSKDIINYALALTVQWRNGIRHSVCLSVESEMHGGEFLGKVGTMFTTLGGSCHRIKQ